MAVLLDSFAWFALRGRGTPAPFFVVGYEERTLHRTFGTEYEAFKANVPRWIPRLRPWRASSAGGT